MRGRVSERRRARSEHARWLVLSSVLIGTLAPSESSAQEEATVPPKGDVAVAADAAPDEIPDEIPDETTDEPARFELSLGVTPTLGGLLGLSGTGALGGLQGAGLLPVAVDVGFPLGSRALLTLGGGGSYFETPGGQAVSLHLPISLLCYLDRPRAGAFVPLVRVLARGTFSEMSTTDFTVSSLGLGAGVRGGLTYFFHEALALRLEVGGAVAAGFSPSSTSVALDLESAITLVLRA